MRRYFGGKADYALLGATSASTSSVDDAALCDLPVESAILPRLVRLGLPDQYRGGIARAFALGTLTPMRIVVAAHHDVDSSVVAFYDATKVLSALLVDGETLIDRADDDITALARAALRACPFTA